jgi:hypothetical protein
MILESQFMLSALLYRSTGSIEYTMLSNHTTGSCTSSILDKKKLSDIVEFHGIALSPIIHHRPHRIITVRNNKFATG